VLSSDLTGIHLLGRNTIPEKARRKPKAGLTQRQSQAAFSHVSTSENWHGIPGYIPTHISKQIDGISDASYNAAIGTNFCARPNCRIHGQAYDATIRWYDIASHAEDD
jgi:hypothetical protein